MIEERRLTIVFMKCYYCLQLTNVLFDEFHSFHFDIVNAVSLDNFQGGDSGNKKFKKIAKNRRKPHKRIPQVKVRLYSLNSNISHGFANTAECICIEWWTLKRLYIASACKNASDQGQERIIISPGRFKYYNSLILWALKYVESNVKIYRGLLYFRSRYISKNLGEIFCVSGIDFKADQEYFVVVSAHKNTSDCWAGIQIFNDKSIPGWRNLNVFGILLVV